MPTTSGPHHAGHPAPEVASGVAFTVEVSEVVTQFLAGRTTNTALAYRRDLNHFLSWCHGHGLHPWQARRSHIAEYLQDQHNVGLTPATVSRRLTALRGFYLEAHDVGAVADRPTDRLNRRRPTPATRINALTRPQLEALLQTADQTSVRAAALVWLLAGTGLRISEACSTRLEDRITDAHGVTWIDVVCKGGQVRSVPLIRSVSQRVDVLAGERSSGPIIITRTGSPLHRNQAASIVNTVAVRAGIRAPFSPHVLRHTFVTLARQAGCGIEDVQDAVGHADIQTTRRYDRTVLGSANHPANRVLPDLA